MLSPITLLIALGASFAMGIFIGFIYIKTTRKKIPSQGFALTMVILPAVISVIIMLVGSNVARAFSLAGAFSIIRFRSAPGSPKDITYVLMTMAVGLACGMGHVLYGVMMAVILGLFMLVLEFSNFGSVGSEQKLLRITIPENLDYKDVFSPVLKKYTKDYSLNRLKSTNLGSLYELEYRVTMDSEVDEKEFVDDLRVRNGNLNVMLIMSAIAADD